MPSHAPAPPNLDLARYRAAYHGMWRIRAFEEAAMRAVGDRLVHGAIHPSIGQEAVAVGICGNLAAADAMLSTHRGHGHTLAKGADSLAMMRELFGREGGTCHGKGGSMHIADFGVGMLGANGVVGANIVIAVGAAHAIRLRREERIVCCLFGDGAINRGPFLEGLNWAGVWKLPVLFVCEDNGFAASTRTDAMTSGDGPAARARALGIPAASGFHTNFQQYMAHYRMPLLEKATMSYLRHVHNRSACTFVPSRDVIEQLDASGFENLQLLPKGVDTKLFNPKRRSLVLRQTWGAGAGAPVAAARSITSPLLLTERTRPPLRATLCIRAWRREKGRVIVRWAWRWRPSP